VGKVFRKCCLSSLPLNDIYSVIDFSFVATASKKKKEITEGI
jgi:hypothetical protein